MSIKFRPVGRFLLLELNEGDLRLGLLDCGRVVTTGVDVKEWLRPGVVVAYRGRGAVSPELESKGCISRVLVHEDDIVAVVTEMA